MNEYRTGARNKNIPALHEINCFVLDMDGTINLGDTVIPGAHAFVGFLKENGISFYFFTNNSSRSPQVYVERLHMLGFTDVTREQVMTSGDVMIHVLKEHKPHPQIFLSGTPALCEQFENAGIRLLEPDCPTADFAVLGFDTTFSFQKADTLCRLAAAGVPFYATNIDRVCPLAGGAFLPDCGSMAAMIEHATGIAPVFVGKPSVLTAAYILAHTHTPAEKTAVVGDRLYTDILTGIDGGLISIAVLSGEISREDIEKSEVQPDYIFDSVADIHTALRGTAVKSF